MHLILANMKPGESGHVAAIAWDRIPFRERRRLRELGLIEGANIELLDRDNVSRSDPIAVRIGVGTVIIDRAYATAVGIAKGAAA